VAVYRRIIGELRLARSFEVVADCEIALDAATAGGPGAVLICGTGSVCFGRDPSGAWTRAGGWGPVIGDEGSGYDIGRRALNACARAHDGLGPPTALTELVLRRVGAARVTELPVAVRTGLGRAEIASMAQCVLGAAYGLKDPVARDIVREAARHLAKTAEIVARRLAPGAPVTLTGGLFESEPRFADDVTSILRAQFAGAVVKRPDLPPVAGALWRAARAAGASSFDMSALAALRKGAQGDDANHPRALPQDRRRPRNCGDSAGNI